MTTYRGPGKIKVVMGRAERKSAARPRWEETVSKVAR